MRSFWGDTHDHGNVQKYLAYGEYKFAATCECGESFSGEDAPAASFKLSEHMKIMKGETVADEVAAFLKSEVEK